MLDNRRSNTVNRLIYIALIAIGGVYIAVLLGITLFRNTTDRRLVQLVPFSFIIDFLSGEMTTGYLFKNVLGSIALYFPMGVLLPCLFPSFSLRKTLFAGFLTSLCCELVQYAAAIGTADINDLICNTIGTLAGAILYLKVFMQGKTKRIARLLSLALLTVYGICGFCVMLRFLPEILPMKTVYVNQELLGNDDLKSYDLAGYCREIRDDSVLLGDDTELCFSQDAVILLKKQSYKVLPDGYIYKTVIEFEVSAVQAAQTLIASQGNTECAIWLDGDSACRMLILTDMSI